jgi:hypothetical protein
MVMNCVKRAGLVLFIIAVVLALSSLAGAETENKEESFAYQEFDSYLRYMPSRSIKTTSGKVEMIRSGNTYNYGFKAFGKLPVKLSLDTEYISIENTLRHVELPAHLVGLSGGIETTLPFFRCKNTYFRLGLEPSFYSDDADFKSSAFRIPSYYYLIYLPNSKWIFLSGIAVYPDFEDEVLPIVGFIYKPNDKLSFNIVPKRPNITYALNNRVSLFTEGSLALNKEFEVKRDNAENVVLTYKETRLGSGIKFRFNRYIQASVSAGGLFKRRLRYRDNQGKVDIKDGLYTEFRVEIK